MGYAASGYCFPTGAEATVALSSYRSGLGGNPCPYVWDGNAAVFYNLSSGACVATASKVTFASCTNTGPIGPNESVLWNLTPADAITLSASIIALWALAWVFRILIQFTRSHFVDSGES